jgi:hypothetical protein
MQGVKSKILLQSHKSKGKEFEFLIAILGHVSNETQPYYEQKILRPLT